MKSNILVNSALFKAESLSTRSITSGITIFHPLTEPGTYNGTVFNKDREAGSFLVTCSEGTAEMQADIDLKNFDTILAANTVTKTQNFSLRPGGYLVMYCSFGEGEYVVRLTNEKTDYQTTDLQKGDLVMALLLQPGEYKMVSSTQQECSISVGQLTGDPPSDVVSITLNDEAFSPDQAKLIQGQGLIIHLETAASLIIQLTGTSEFSATPDQQDSSPKRHNWENPKYKYGKGS